MPVSSAVSAADQPRYSANGIRIPDKANYENRGGLDRIEELGEGGCDSLACPGSNVGLRSLACHIEIVQHDQRRPLTGDGLANGGVG